jgi:hypothetical protein
VNIRAFYPSQFAWFRISHSVRLLWASIDDSSGMRIAIALFQAKTAADSLLFTRALVRESYASLFLRSLGADGQIFERYDRHIDGAPNSEI